MLIEKCQRFAAIVLSLASLTGSQLACSTDTSASFDDGSGPGDGSPNGKGGALNIDVGDSTGPLHCGDGLLDADESCDDGNVRGGDGCSESCVPEPGYECLRVGAGCEEAVICGDGLQAPSETCDDGNRVSGDGCIATCGAVESGYACATPGAPCALTSICGNGFLEGTEQCDDGNAQSDDGCSTSCTLESGFECAEAGTRCKAVCGDGKVLGAEQCEDGNGIPTAGDGCSASCLLESGWACPVAGQPCHETVCGDGVVEGSEPCDRADPQTMGRCTIDCKLKPVCRSPQGVWGACQSQCGDGITIPGDVESCDDGNTRDGDGCSHDCKIELGYECSKQSVIVGDSVELPIVYRDFKGYDVGGNVDFENSNNFGKEGLRRGQMVEPTLDAEGKPVMRSSIDSSVPLSTVANFRRWYRDDARTCSDSSCNKAIYSSITLTRPSANAPFAFDQLGSFFPIDGFGWQSSSLAANQREPNKEAYEYGGVENGAWALKPGNNQNRSLGWHNFSFTTELRYWFEFRGGESLEFYGDDDVWVFISGQLVLDMGGIKREVVGKVVMNADGTATVTYTNNLPWTAPPTVTPSTTIQLGLEKQRVYEIVVLQAERRTQLSSYKLTLGAFDQQKWECRSKCGDGNVAPDEVCDAGTDNDGRYGGCTADCRRGPYCGDGIVQDVEYCDDGQNVTGYGASGCAPGCKKPASCGDGAVDSAFGEACDDPTNTSTGYGSCSGACKLAAFAAMASCKLPRSATAAILAASVVGRLR